MGRYDKDRRQKEMAIRYCLARGIAPCLEVLVPSASDLSDSSEILTDIDVLGLQFMADGGFRRTIFDCKTTNKMSPVNRAFWAAGVLRYAACDEAVVILKNRAVHNHRLSGLKISVDLHDEKSFEDLGKTFDLMFDADLVYQSSMDRWNQVYDIYVKHAWSEGLYILGRSQFPVSNQPWAAFRRLIAELKSVRGHVDPAKPDHVVIFLDVLAAASILWSSMGRDIRRFYDPSMDKAAFEKILRYYIWGGKEAYQIRQELRGRLDDDGQPLEFPAWGRLVGLAGLVIAAPQEFFGCIHVCRELAFRRACGGIAGHDKRLSDAMNRNKRVRQFVPALSDYLIAACGLPKDLSDQVQAELSLAP